MAGEQGGSTPTVTISKKKLDDIIAGAAVRDAQGNKIHTTYLRVDSPLIGKTIRTITKTATSGLTDTYTITFTDNTTWDYYVTNGKDGADGAKGDKGDKGDTGDTYASLYHLGSYDSVDTSNADYDVITRGTGYLVINAENITSVGEGAGNHITFGLTNLKTPMVDTSGPFGGTIGVSSNGYNVARVSGYWVGDLTIALTGDDYAVIGNDSLSTVADFQALCPIYIEYKLSSTYTEKVLKNQPISQLDQNGENWLRGEHEKTLNLLQEKISQSDVWAIKLGTAYLENGKTYSLSLSKDVAGSMLYAGNYTFFTSYNFYRRGSFTFNGTTGSYELTLRGTYPSSSGYAPTWAMLNEGSTALPYQPYNGPVMHEADIKPSHIAFFHSNGSQLVPQSGGLPSGCYLSCQGSYELDLNAMVLRFKMSLWTHGTTTGLSSAEFRMFTPAQLLSLINLPYSFDSSRSTLGMWHYNNPNDNPSYTGLGTCFHIISDGYYSASRAYDVDNASAIGAWGMKELFEGTNGIAVDFVMPIKY